MGACVDLINQKFNRLTVLYKTDKRQNNSVVWHCICDCGTECDVSSSALRANKTKSCGCLKKETDRAPKGNVKDELGHVYGHLTVIGRAGSNKSGEAQWLCECDCENHSQIVVLGNNLRRGHTTSCGCDRASQGEKAIALLLLNNQIPFTTQKRFEDFSNYSFDFYINNEYLIEYDGETHYKYNLHGWHDKEQYEAQRVRDEIKNEWCRAHNIPLIRIPYTHLTQLAIDDLLLDKTQFLINK